MDTHGCDFGRVRNTYLDTNAKYFRQMFVLGVFMTPEMMKFFNQSMSNATENVKTNAEYAGSMIDLGVQVRRAVPPPAPNPTIPLTNYHITDIYKNRSSNLSRRPRCRFDFFTKAVLPSLPRNTFTSISIFIPRYLTSSECGTTSTTPLSPSVPSRKKHLSPPSPTHSHLSSPGRHLSSLAVTRFFFTVGERITSAATTSAQLEEWYSAPCRITYFSTARSRVPLLGGALARGRLRRSRRCV